MLNTRKVWLLCALVFSVSVVITNSSCKSCNKKQEAATAKVDTSAAPSTPVNSINLPHADTSLIPVLSKILDQAFDASGKKDYQQFGSFIIYRGPDTLRYGQDVFNARNKYEKGVLRITSDVFNKWNKGVEHRTYARAFEMDQMDGRKLEVLEVIFESKNNTTRKFFGFLKLKDDYKIADVTSYL